MPRPKPTLRRTPKPWKTVSTKRLGSVGKVRLLVDHLISNSGFRMDHPRLILPDFAIVVPVIDDEKLVFIWNYRPPIRAWELELPAGHMDGGENPQTGARRELEEETGYSARAWKRLGWFYTAPGTSSQRAYAFLANGLKKGSAHREPYEKMDVRILGIKKAYQLAWSGKIIHSPTICALGLAHDLLLNEHSRHS